MYAHVGRRTWVCEGSERSRCEKKKKKKRKEKKRAWVANREGYTKKWW